MKKSPYENHLKALHMDAKQTAAALLAGIEKDSFSRQGTDHNLLFAFELMR